MNDLCEIAQYLSDHMKDRENPNNWRKATLRIIGAIAQNTTANLSNYPKESSQKNITDAIKLSFKKLYSCLLGMLDHKIYFNRAITRQVENLRFPEKYEETEASDDEEQKNPSMISAETQKNIAALNEKKMLATPMLKDIQSPAKDINPETLLTIFQLPLMMLEDPFIQPKNDQELIEKYFSLLGTLTLAIKEIIQFDLITQYLNQPPIQQCIQNTWETLSPMYTKQRESFKNKFKNIAILAKNKSTELSHSITTFRKELEGDALETTISELFSFTDDHLVKLDTPINKAVAILFFELARERMRQHSQEYLKKLNVIESALKTKPLVQDSSGLIKNP